MIPSKQQSSFSSSFVTATTFIGPKAILKCYTVIVIYIGNKKGIRKYMLFA
jgi:hypothetical protein